MPAPGETSPSNLVSNGTFDVQGFWKFAVGEGTATLSVDKGAGVNGHNALHAQVTVPPPNDAFAEVQAVQHGIQLQQNKHLYLTFYAKGDSGTVLDTTIIPASALTYQVPEYATFYAFFQADLTTSWQHYVVDVIPFATDGNAILTFNFGAATGNLWVSDVGLSPQVPSQLPWEPQLSDISGAADTNPAAGTAPQSWKLVWDSGFSGGTVDSTKWRVLSDGQGGYTNKSVPGAQYWTPSALTVIDGNLRIATLSQKKGGYSFTSGALTTESRFSFTYGRVDIRAQMPYGNGLWTGVWFLQAPTGTGQAQKTNDTQEIDLLEYLGQQPSKPYFVHHFGFSGDEWCTFKGPDLSKGFHTYSLVWSPTALDEYFDGLHRCHVTGDIPAVPMYLLMQTSVNGGFPVPVDSTTVFPQYTTIDYVRVYQSA